MTKTNIKTLIIQAGGRGSRMGHLTENKPKILVPFKGKTILQHFMDNYPECDFIVICDYKREVLNAYIDTVISPYYTNHITVVETNDKGTYSGLAVAKSVITHNKPIGVVWSDLIISGSIIHNNKFDIQVYTTEKIECRYSFEGKVIVKQPNIDRKKKTQLTGGGIFGLFTLKNKDFIEDKDYDSFVGDFLIENIDKVSKKSSHLKTVTDIGTLSRYEKQLDEHHSRYFNMLRIDKRKNIVTKQCVVPEYQHLLQSELVWYDFVNSNLYKKVPKIFSKSPFTLEFVRGYHPHKNKSFGLKEFTKILDALEELHNLGSTEVVPEDVKLVYFFKPMERVREVEPLIVFYEHETININNYECINPFHPKHFLKFMDTLKSISPERFTVIHGDPTSSNIIMRNNGEACLFDPRGVFGKNPIFGDPCYDYAKLYYSLFGGYDSINSQQFHYRISSSLNAVFLINMGLGYTSDQNPQNEVMKNLFFERTKHLNYDKCKNFLIQSTLWFSLCGYVKEDYDAINYAFLQGCINYTKYLKCQILSN